MRVRLQYRASTVVERRGVFWVGMANGMAQSQAPINSRPRGRGETSRRWRKVPEAQGKRLVTYPRLDYRLGNIDLKKSGPLAGVRVALGHQLELVEPRPLTEGSGIHADYGCQGIR